MAFYLMLKNFRVTEYVGNAQEQHDGKTRQITRVKMVPVIHISQSFIDERDLHNEQLLQSYSNAMK